MAYRISFTSTTNENLPAKFVVVFMAEKDKDGVIIIEKRIFTNDDRCGRKWKGLYYERQRISFRFQTFFYIVKLVQKFLRSTGNDNY